MAIQPRALQPIGYHAYVPPDGKHVREWTLFQFISWPAVLTYLRVYNGDLIYRPYTESTPTRDAYSCQLRDSQSTALLQIRMHPRLQAFVRHTDLPRAAAIMMGRMHATHALRGAVRDTVLQVSTDAIPERGRQVRCPIVLGSMRARPIRLHSEARNGIPQAIHIG